MQRFGQIIEAPYLLGEERLIQVEPGGRIILPVEEAHRIWISNHISGGGDRYIGGTIPVWLAHYALCLISHWVFQVVQDVHFLIYLVFLLFLFYQYFFLHIFSDVMLFIYLYVLNIVSSSVFLYYRFVRGLILWWAGFFCSLFFYFMGFLIFWWWILLADNLEDLAVLGEELF